MNSENVYLVTNKAQIKRKLLFLVNALSLFLKEPWILFKQ